jgi:hypothetical protein
MTAILTVCVCAIIGTTGWLACGWAYRLGFQRGRHFQQLKRIDELTEERKRLDKLHAEIRETFTDTSGVHRAS